MDFARGRFVPGLQSIHQVDKRGGRFVRRLPIPMFTRFAHSAMGSVRRRTVKIAGIKTQLPRDSSRISVFADHFSGEPVILRLGAPCCNRSRGFPLRKSETGSRAGLKKETRTG